MASRTYPNGLTVNQGYTDLGYLQSLSLATPVTLSPLPATVDGTRPAPVNLPAGYEIWGANERDATGTVTRQRLGNGLKTSRVLEEATGRVTALKVGTSADAADAMSIATTWDSLGRLKQREAWDGVSAAVRDSFTQDALGRLTNHGVVRIAGSGTTQALRNVTITYNPLGNVLYKSDVGVYSYNASGAGSVRPHAVTRVRGAGTIDYSYDASGNMTAASAGGYSSISYTSFNLPDSGQGAAGPRNGGTNYEWEYDEALGRVREIRSVAAGDSVGAGAGTRTTFFVHPDNAGGLDFESEVDEPASPSTANPAGSMQRHYLSAGGMTVAVLVTNSSVAAISSNGVSPNPASGITASKLEYWHQDHLGSLSVTTDHGGNVMARYAYDPYGKRRNVDGSDDAQNKLIGDWNSATSSGTDRGFTGHEHLDDIGVIHMNGRLFDPRLGRFLQADPMTADPADLQSYDRYGYCAGDPLGCVDPSGYFGWRGLINAHINRATLGGAKALSRSSTGRMIGSIGIGAASAVVMIWCVPCGIAMNGFGQAAWAGYNGASLGQATRTGVVSAASTALTYEVGETWRAVKRPRFTAAR